MRRPPVTIYLLSMAVICLVVLMVLEGLHCRVYGFFPQIKGVLWGSSTHLADWLAGGLACEACVSAEKLAWPILVVGLTWIGALVAFWLKLSWSVRAIIILGIFSLAFWIPGLVLTIIIWVCLWLRPTRIWFGDISG